MNLKQAKEQGKQYLEQYLESKGINTKDKHFTCINRNHPDKHPSMSLDPSGDFVRCWSCNKTYDIYGAIQEIDGLSFNDALDYVCRTYHIGYLKEDQRAPRESKDYTSFYLDANKHLSETNYHRGISLETLNKYNIGYVEKWINPDAKTSNHPSPRLIIPISKSSYLARDTRPNNELTQIEQRYTKLKTGSQNSIFNGDVIKDASDYVFITEGEIDALSLIDLGYRAIATGSTAYIKNVVKHIKSIDNREIVYLVFMDKDHIGERAGKELISLLTGAGYICDNPHVTEDHYHKDANEWLLDDKESLKEWLKDHTTQSYLDSIRSNFQIENNDHIDTAQEYRHTSSAYLAYNLKQDVLDESIEPIKSGFRKLDYLMDDGFYEGLYVLGADTGTGKTTLVMQIAENIARSGKDVLFIALEMSARELIARSISRLTYENAIKSSNLDNARTSRDLLRAKRLNELTNEQYDAVDQAINEYATYGDHLYIREGIGDIDANKVREFTQLHRDLTGNTPIVIIDYLQILAPINPRLTDKQNMDISVVSLKRISRDFKTSVICISSLNRETNKNNKEGKTEDIGKTGFKESGAIEYASDMIFALGRSEDEQPDPEQEDNNKPRKMSLKILKARSSRFNVSTNFDYYPRYSYFKEI